MARRILTAGICWFLGLSVLEGQDFHFVHSPLVAQALNPGQVGGGTMRRTSVTALYRGQWDNLISNRSYQGGGVFADMRYCLPSSRKHFYGLGVGVQYDFSLLGGLIRSGGGFSGAYHHHLGSETFLSAGGSLGFVALGIGDRLTFDEQFQQGAFSSANGNGESMLGQQLISPDAGAGFSFYNLLRGWSVGMSWRHLNTPRYTLLDSENRLGISWVLNGSWTVWQTRVQSARCEIRGMLRRQSVSGRNSAQWLGSAGLFYGALLSGHAGVRLRGGAYARVGGLPGVPIGLNTLTPVLEWLTEDYALALGYDMNIARIQSRFSGGLELMFSARFGNPDRCIVCRW
jgi:type IX secretion system PorP/SprF family membrane protein